MAAILCNACCVQPCRALSSCCNKFANILAPCCGGLCRCCKDVCEWFNGVFSEPLSCFLILAIGLLGSVSVGAVLALIGDLNGCSGPMMIWFVVAVLESIGHLAYAFYCFNRIHNRDRTSENYFMVLYKLLVHDPWTAIYIVFDIFGLVWCFIGLNWSKNCPDQVSTIGPLFAYGLLFYIAVSYFAMIFNLFSESVQNNICFCIYCVPFIMFPCCFGESLRRSYARQQQDRNQGQQVRYQPAANGDNGFQQAKSSQNYQWHPVPPQVSGRPEAQNRSQEETPVLEQAAGAVGSYLWNKAFSSNNRSDNRGRV
jgi:hypothetical protein